MKRHIHWCGARRLILAATFGSVCIIQSACAQDGKKSLPGPYPHTAQEQLEMSDLVVLAKATRVVLVAPDPEAPGKTLEYDQVPAGMDAQRLARYAYLRVDRVVCKKEDAAGPTEIRVVLPSDFSTVEKARTNYLERPLIYFLRKGYGRMGPRTRIDPLEFAQARGRTAYPEGVETLKLIAPFLSKYCTAPSRDRTG